jgi:hypothetical protein
MQCSSMLKYSINNIKLDYQAPQVINSCNETVFVYPVTENKIIEVVKKFKGKYLAGTDEIPDFVVEKFIEMVKLPLAHIYIASLEVSVFPERFKFTKVKPFHKKGDKRDMEIIDQYFFYVHSQISWKS